MPDDNLLEAVIALAMFTCTIALVLLLGVALA